MSTLCLICGVAAILTGLWWVYPPLALVFLGVTLIAFAKGLVNLQNKDSSDGDS